jgi:hypothetical protein
VDVERLEPAEVGEAVVEALGLDSHSLDPGSTEALAASIRRAASFLCPTTPRRLVSGVSEALAGVPGCGPDLTLQLETLIDSMIGYGDLLELPSQTESAGRRQLFLGVPAFVRRAGTNNCLLFGIRADGAPLVGDDLLDLIEHEGHVRVIGPGASECIHEQLAASGLMELQMEQWLQAPRAAAPGEIISFYTTRLAASASSGDVEGLSVIDPDAPVTYYRGRWRGLRESDHGRFVGRRAQAFGADLWCLVDVVAGDVSKLLDLPVQSPLAPGADEAWRLQAALDALGGRPQQLRVRPRLREGWTAVDFFSPVPSWMQRRLDVVGMPLERSGGALFTYALPDQEVAEELAFAGDLLWLDPIVGEEVN